MKPFDLKKLSERRVELMARLEGMVSTCQMETRAFNEEERASYSKILDEVRSIGAPPGIGPGPVPQHPG